MSYDEMEMRWGPAVAQYVQGEIDKVSENRPTANTDATTTNDQQDAKETAQIIFGLTQSRCTEV